MSNISKSKRTAASIAFLAVGGAALIGGTYAQFTDRATTSVQELQAGTVNVDLTEGANWDTSNLLLGIDDTVSRSLTVGNTGNLAIKALTLSANITETAGLDATAALSDAVLVTIKQDGVALATDVALADVTSYNLNLATPLVPASNTVLTFEYKVVGTADGSGDFVNGDFTSGDRTDFTTNPDNRFQDASVSVDFTVDAIQRDGIAQ